MLGDARKFWRFSAGLRCFLRDQLTPEDCTRIACEQLRNREDSFLGLLRRAVYGYPPSPYRALLEWAGAEYGDVEGMVRQDGIEAALEKLHDAGVYVRLDEFKGKREITRTGLRLPVRAEDFDNPLVEGAVVGASGGSTGPRHRTAFDFDLLVEEAANVYLMLSTNGLATMPLSIWRAVPPGAAGLKQALQAAKFGRPMERWFSPQQLSWRAGQVKFAALTRFAVAASGGTIPNPMFVPLNSGAQVARWLADKVSSGTPAMLSAPANSAARACIAAKEHGIDIVGTAFLVSGEPFTEAKRQLVYGLGARSVSTWAMAECGTVGLGCANREAVDEVHLVRGRIAAFQRPKTLADGATQVDALQLTGLMALTPKIMLNVDIGDYGVLRERRCGCPLGELGHIHTLHTIRNYEKLTTGGMHFMGSSVIQLVEEVLPRAHGGEPSDYQFVDDQTGDLNRIRIVVSPRVGTVDEARVLDSMFQFMAADSPSTRMMGELWKQGDLVRVAREEPFVTAAGKIPQLWVVR